MSRRSNFAGLVLAAALGAKAVRGEEIRLTPVADPAENSPKEPLRQALFKERLGTPGCVPVKADPRGTTGLDPSLDRFLKEVIEAIKARNAVALQPLFHKRMNVSMAAIGETFARLNNFYGKPYDLSIYRLWALNTVDGTPGRIPCPEDGLALHAMYGYPLQLGAWLQILGPKELGRIYVAIVPAAGRWHLGAFHAQQWTHLAKDHAAWTEEAARAVSKGHAEAAYAKYDIAAKLLDGGPFIEVARRDEVVKARDGVMTGAAWDNSLKKALKDFDVIYTATVLVEDGVGVLVRTRIQAELSLEGVKARCKQLGQKLLLLPWSADLAGVRCSFNLPKEDAKTEGVQGGMYLAFAEIRDKP